MFNIWASPFIFRVASDRHAGSVLARMTLPSAHRYSVLRVTRNYIRSTSSETHFGLQRDQIDIQSVYPHCFPINPYWKFSSHAKTRVDTPSNCNLFMKIYCIRHYRAADSFPAGTTLRTKITLFNSLFAYITYECRGRGPYTFLSEHVNRVCYSCTFLISLDLVKVLSKSPRGEISSSYFYIRTICVSRICKTLA